jgi:hypothetical protein
VILALIRELIVLSSQPSPSTMSVLVDETLIVSLLNVLLSVKIIVAQSLGISAAAAAVVLLLPVHASANQHGRTSPLVGDALQ